MIESIERKIVQVRDSSVMLDVDLAKLYGVAVKRFNEQIKRNLDRFPSDFMFQLNQHEWDCLRSQIATLDAGRGQYRKYLPFAFTEHGVLMAANVLKSKVATNVSVRIIRVFNQLRRANASNQDFIRRLNLIEARIDGNDQKIEEVFGFIRAMIEEPKEPEPFSTLPNRVGFK